MATSYTGSFANAVTKINEAAAANGWGISATYTTEDTYYGRLRIKNSSGNTLMIIQHAQGTDANGYGMSCLYNNGSSTMGSANYSLGVTARTVTLYFTSHGFIVKNNSSKSATYGVVTFNDDGTILCGTNTIASGGELTNLGICKYDETSYMTLTFIPHQNPSGATLCNGTAVGGIGDPQVTQYFCYAPVYQTTVTGQVDIDGEHYISIGGYWYLKD